MVSLLWFIVPLSVLAALVVPNYLNARNRARQKRTMADMRTIATAIEARATDVNRYDLDEFIGPMWDGNFLDFDTLHPVTFSALERSLVGKYIRVLPRYDGWGTEFDVRVDRNEEMYAVRSAGSDRTFEPPPYAMGAIESFETDIVISEGNFVQYPEGSCSQ